MTTNDGNSSFYNLDEVPEPEDLTPATCQTTRKILHKRRGTSTSTASQPSVQPSREKHLQSGNAKSRSLAEFKNKLNLPGRIADLENEPAYKRRNISIEDTPQSSESQVSRMRQAERI